MAKKNILTYIPPTYYVYYDNVTGSILCVTNEKTDRYEYGIEVEFEEVEKLISGEWNFQDFIVGQKKLSDQTIVKCLMPSIEQDYAFRHNVFEWITQKDYDCEFIVEWNLPNKTWYFSLNSSYKSQYQSQLLMSKIMFFVTLEEDFNFLIRTIYIDIKELLNSDQVPISFESKKELDIDKISISSKLVFKTYNLKIVYE